MLLGTNCSIEVTALILSGAKGATMVGVGVAGAKMVGVGVAAKVPGSTVCSGCALWGLPGLSQA